MNNMRFAIQRFNRRFIKWTWFKWYADKNLRDRNLECLTGFHSCSGVVFRAVDPE